MEALRYSNKCFEVHRIHVNFEEFEKERHQLRSQLNECKMRQKNMRRALEQQKQEYVQLQGAKAEEHRALTHEVDLLRAQLLEAQRNSSVIKINFERKINEVKTQMMRSEQELLIVQKQNKELLTEVSESRAQEMFRPTAGSGSDFDPFE